MEKKNTELEYKVAITVTAIVAMRIFYLLSGGLFKALLCSTMFTAVVDLTLIY